MSIAIAEVSFDEFGRIVQDERGIDTTGVWSCRCPMSGNGRVRRRTPAAPCGCHSRS